MPSFHAISIGRGIVLNTPSDAAAEDGCGIIAVGDSLAFTESPVATINYVDAAIAGIGAGVSDHGDLTGLGDDDHSQYYNAARLASAISGKANLAGANFTGEIQIASAGSLYRQLQLVGGPINTAQTFTDSSTGNSFTIGTANSKFYLSASQYILTVPIMAGSVSGMHFSSDSNLYGVGRLNCEVASGASAPALHCLVRGSAGSEDLIRVGTWSGSITGRWRSNGSIEVSAMISSGSVSVGAITKSALLTLSATATAGSYRVTDSTPAQRRVWPDGTNWRYMDDGAIVT
jgi:hypothetical protein